MVSSQDVGHSHSPIYFLVSSLTHLLRSLSIALGVTVAASNVGFQVRGATAMATIIIAFEPLVDKERSRLCHRGGLHLLSFAHF